MSEPIRVTLVANAGVLLEYRGRRLLLDGLYHIDDHEGNPFSNIPREQRIALLSGYPPFQGNIDCLLFTHSHPDHFSPALAEAYLKKRSVQAVFLPPDDGGQSALRALLQSRNTPFISLEDAVSGCPIPLEDGITVTPYRTRHVDKAFWDIPHYCYLLSFGDKKLLFTADVDYTYETFPQLKSVQLTALFINPLFFGALLYSRFFKGELHAENVCIYHVPFPEDDRMHYRDLLQQRITRWSPERGKLISLEYSGQSFFL